MTIDTVVYLTAIGILSLLLIYFTTRKCPDCGWRPFHRSFNHKLKTVDREYPVSFAEESKGEKPYVES